jgi:LPS export ABC transporter protein LptC
MKTLIAFLYGFGFFLLLLAGSGCKSDMDTINRITARQNFPKESAQNVEMIYTDSGLLKAKLFAPVLERHETSSPYLELPKGIKAYFYSAGNPKPESMLRANYAIRYEAEKRMVLRNEVVVVNVQGDTLETEELIWDELTGKIYSEKFVKITTPEHQIWGNGFESNQNFSRYKIKDVRGTMSIKDAEKSN